MKVMLAVLLVLALVGIAPNAHAKDHSNDYQMGTLTKVPLHVGGKVSQGWTDTTSCDSGLVGIHCTGGIVDDYSGWLVADMPDGKEVVIETCASGASLAAALLPCDRPYILALTEEDGTFVFLDHTWMHHDVSAAFDTKSQVLYRIEHHGGVTYFMIPDPTDPKKEGSYNPIKLPKQAKSAVPAPSATDNLTAMCASGKLSAEQTAKYCGTQAAPVPTK